MIIKKEFNEIITDLIANRLSSPDGNEYYKIAEELLRYGHDGFINMNKEVLAKEAMRIKLYGENVESIEII